MEDPWFPIVRDFYQQRIAFAVQLRILNGLRVIISATDDSSLIAGQGYPTVGFCLAQNTHSLFGAHHKGSGSCYRKSLYEFYHGTVNLQWPKG
jgi:hypothetical protein